ncbi:MAG: hypothetical protein PHD48_06960 [Alphaproteobacteria bacterium]|nr:hypothetical protein [Alphaproteobacteria bacterium]
MKLRKLYPGSIYRVDNTDQIIELLAHTLAAASRESLSGVWASSPHINAVRRLATEHPGMAASFQDYAASPLYENYPLRKVMAAYVALETSPAGSSREIESLSLFTDNSIKLIDHNNQCGLPNDDAYCLFISAGKLSKGETAETIQKYTFRRQELMQLLPTVIARCTVNDPFSKVICADRALPLPNCPETIKNRIIDLALDGADEISKGPCLDVNRWAETIGDFTNISASIGNAPARLARHMEIWSKLIDDVYMVDPVNGVGLARTVWQSGTPAHPDVVQAALNVIKRYRVPVTPNEHGPTVMAHMGLTTQTYH